MRKLLLTGGMALSTCVYAEESVSHIEQLLSMDLGRLMQIEVATGTQITAKRAPAAVSYITEADIVATGAQTLAEALEMIPGLHVATSHIRSLPLYSIRGIQTGLTPHVLLMVDGVELKLFSSTNQPLGFSYPVSAIKRIEVIRGPGSAVYGADAFSGVINVITKRAEQSASHSLGGTMGSFGKREFWTNNSFNYRDIKGFVALNYEKFNDDSDRVLQGRKMNTARESTSIHVNLNNGHWSMDNWFYDVRHYMGTGAGFYANETDLDESWLFKSKLNYHTDLTEKLKLDASISVFDYSSRVSFTLFPAGNWPVGEDGNLLTPPFNPVEFPDGVIGRPDSEQETYNASVAMIYTPDNKHRIRAAVGYRAGHFRPMENKNFGPGILDTENFTPVSTSVLDVTGTPFIYAPNYSQQLKYISLQDEWDYSENLHLTAGIRYDDYSNFGSTVNPRFALVWDTSDSLTTKLLYGSAFRAPTVAETQYINNPASIGNPDIKPENIDTLEVVFDYQARDNLTTGLNLFSYKAKDLIVLDKFSLFQNQGKQTGYGAEFEVAWKATKTLLLNSNIAYQHAEDTQGNPKALIPKLQAYLDIRYAITDDVQLSTQTYWIANRRRESGDSRPEINNNLSTNVNFSYQLSEKTQLQLQIKNLLNRSLREPAPSSPLFQLSELGNLLGIDLPNLGFYDDIPLTGRSISLSLQYNYN